MERWLLKLLPTEGNVDLWPVTSSIPAPWLSGTIGAATLAVDQINATDNLVRISRLTVAFQVYASAASPRTERYALAWKPPLGCPDQWSLGQGEFVINS